MIDIPKVLDEILKQREYINILVNSLSEDYFMDKSIDLEERWAIFTEVVDKKILVNIHCYDMSFINTLENSLSLYEDFYIEKYQTVSYTEMYSQIQDLEIEKEQVDNWREEVLSSKHSGFINDW